MISNMEAFDNDLGQATRSLRGTGAADVALAADALLREGLRPTIERVRGKLGRGSPNTINPLLDLWWKGLAARLSGGPEMLERIPAAAFHVLEALWVQLQIAARDRAAVSLASEQGAAHRAAESLEVRSQVLSLREGELNERLRRQEERVRGLEEQLGETSGHLRRALVDASAARKSAKALEIELSNARARITSLLTHAVVRERTRRMRGKKSTSSTAPSRAKKATRALPHAVARLRKRARH